MVKQILNNPVVRGLWVAFLLLVALAVTSVALTATACNTVKGVGQDIKKAGEAIEGASKK